MAEFTVQDFRPHGIDLSPPMTIFELTQSSRQQRRQLCASLAVWIARHVGPAGWRKRQLASVGCSPNSEWITSRTCYPSQSSILRGQSSLSSRDSERSASTLPPVWQEAQ